VPHRELMFFFQFTISVYLVLDLACDPPSLTSLQQHPKRVSFGYFPSHPSLVGTIVKYLHPTRIASLGFFLDPRQIRNAPKHDLFHI
jgi:hypothetical protein